MLIKIIKQIEFIKGKTVKLGSEVNITFISKFVEKIK